MLGAHSPLSGAHPGAEVWGAGSVPSSAFRGSWKVAALLPPEDWLRRMAAAGNNLKVCVPTQRKKTIQIMTQQENIKGSKAGLVH